MREMASFHALHAQEEDNQQQPWKTGSSGVLEDYDLFHVQFLCF